MSESSTASPGKKALDYAEKTLGVHEVYEIAQKARNDLDTCLTDLSEARDKKRDVEARLTDAELEVAADERGKHPDMSAAGMERHLKVALSNNDAVRELREQHVKIVNDIDGLECDKLMSETDIKIAVARLHELGGYFGYLAAIKNQAAKPVKQPDSKGIWE